MTAYALWATVCGFLLGVFTQSFVSLGFGELAFVLLLGSTAVAVAFFERSKITAPVFFFVCCCAFVLGAMRMGSALPHGDPLLDDRLQSEVVIEGIVAAEPDVRESHIRVHVNATVLLASTSIPIHAGILVVVPAHTRVAYGDVVRAEGRLELPEIFDTSEGRQFNYPMYLAKEGIIYTLSFAKMESLGENHGNMVQAAAIVVKQKFLAGLHAVLPEPAAGLAGGITVGDKRSIGPELTDTFKAVSLIHVVVLSGYNITIVINWLRRALILLPRALQYGGIAAAVLFIVLMTGGAPSATRAGVMSLIAVYARASARVFIAVRILGVVALGMVLWNPLYLAFDPGFQLSILATLGLVLFTSPIALRLRWISEKWGLREIAASTIATQITVLPLLLYQSGIFSLVALPANLLALIAVPYAMFATFIAAIGGVIAGSFALPLAAPALALLSYIIIVAELFAALPFAAVTIPAFSVWMLFAAYVLMLGTWCLINKKAVASGDATALETRI